MVKSPKPLPPARALRDQAEARLKPKAPALPGAQEPLALEAELRTLHELRVYQLELELQNEELRRAKEELDLARARHFDLFDRAPVGYCTLSASGQILEANQTSATLLGRPRDTLLHQPFASLVFPGDAATCRRHLRQVAQTGDPQAWEVRMVRSDGTVFWVLLQALSGEDGQGGQEVRIALIDLTSGRKTHDTLRKLSTAVEQSPTSIVITDTSGAIEYVNPKFTEITGYTLPEVLGQKPSLLKSGYTTPAVYKELWDTISAGRTWQGEFLNRKKNGDLFWEQAWISPVRDPQGVLTGYVGVKEEITDRKRFEDALRAREAMLARTEAIAQVGSWEWEVATDTVTWSEEMFRILQRDPTAGAPTFAGQASCYHPEDMARLKPLVEDARREGTPYEIELRALLPKGETRIFLARGHAERGPDGKITRLFGSLLDITRSKQLENDLRESEATLNKAQHFAKVGSW
ncbi:MAG: PAS domain S-box protein, partial [Holophagaceae bacterium]|nr:PAS domain S-box protein [Holophagaceae bacterium]